MNNVPDQERSKRQNKADYSRGDGESRRGIYVPHATRVKQANTNVYTSISIALLSGKNTNMFCLKTTYTYIYTYIHNMGHHWVMLP